MFFKELEKLFERAGRFVFSKAKLLTTVITLALLGVMIVCSMGLSLHAGEWVALSLTFLPIFLATSVLSALGVLLIRSYHDEIKNRDTNVAKTVTAMTDSLFTSSYFFLPIILIYLLLWVVLGLFFLMKAIPIIGDAFAVIFAFGPFLLILGSLLLSLASIFLLFTATPVMALKSLTGEKLFQYVHEQRFQQIFLRLVLCLLSLLPLIVTACLLWLAAKITTVVYVDQENTLQMVMQWFFIMLPFAAILSPTVIFFFNMATETHILIQKRSA
ncbi:MAG: Conserved putative rane protein [Chlamydiia bacterium]|nr:Conserved putative rane protein [Chlamydiia bacterium]